jgi:hypothetical protein
VEKSKEQEERDGVGLPGPWFIRCSMVCSVFALRTVVMVTLGPIEILVTLAYVPTQRPTSIILPVPTTV